MMMMEVYACVHGVMAIVVGNGHSGLCSNPGRGSLYFI